MMKTKPSLDEIHEVIEKNEKKRFVLDAAADPARIRAAQGHTIHLEAPVLSKLPPEELDGLVAVHGTSRKSWALIQESGSLQRMERQHVHISLRPGHLRTGHLCEVLLRVDVRGAMDAGHEFFVSTNGVLLTPGPLPLAFVQRVERSDLPDAWQQT
ncbi:unnamed protein product [Pedinophyceae sp. YPF-701]|nr:unnamed protein product [Pedinophyceae sp. YPF-701]